MGRTLLLSLWMLAAMSFTACGGDDGTIDEPTPDTEIPDSSNENPNDPDAPNTPSDSKILVVYFSRTGYNYNSSMQPTGEWLDVGHTARVAGFIAELTGGDTFEILPAVPYPDNYSETVEIARDELNSNARPEIQNAFDNIDEYDTVFIGSPIWHGAVPMIIRTFYESYDLAGKTLVPFSTHAGSGLGNCESVAKSYYPDNTVLSGLAVQGTSSANSRGTVEEWLKRIGIIE